MVVELLDSLEAIKKHAERFRGILYIVKPPISLDRVFLRYLVAHNPDYKGVR